MVNLEALYMSIPEGKERAVMRSELARTFGISKRQVSQHIQNLRLDGIIIASDEHGYYIPRTVEELRAYHDMHRKRAVMELATLRAAWRELKRCEQEIQQAKAS